MACIPASCRVYLHEADRRFQALAFMHFHLVAHRDLGVSDILHNFGGSRNGPQFKSGLLKGAPFRSLFPCRYYIVDLELAVQFSPDSKPESRVVYGVPCLLTHGSDDPAEYGKVRASLGCACLWCVYILTFVTRTARSRFLRSGKIRSLIVLSLAMSSSLADYG
jgi:hypothetical protein